MRVAKNNYFSIRTKLEELRYMIYDIGLDIVYSNLWKMMNLNEKIINLKIMILKNDYFAINSFPRWSSHASNCVGCALQRIYHIATSIVTFNSPYLRIIYESCLLFRGGGVRRAACGMRRAANPKLVKKHEL